MKSVLITGVGGFLGSHLAETFLRLNYRVVGIDNLIGGYKENISDKVEFYNADLTNLQNIAPLFRDINLVVHSACTAYEGLSVFSPSLVTENTSQITTNALSASIQAGVEKFIFMSSMARYGTQDSNPFHEEMTPLPQDPYGIAKYSSELMVRNLSETHGMKYVILVPHNIIGPRQKYDDPYRNVASIMMNRIIHGRPPLIYGNGSQIRCFSFIQDVVNPILVACTNDSVNGEIINIGPDEEFITILELSERISQIMGYSGKPLHVASRPQEVHFATCSANKARKLLNYQTKTTLDEGLGELAKWIKDQPRREFNYHLPLEILNGKTPETWTKRLI
jgi:UDP-glucose 4-epimerase